MIGWSCNASRPAQESSPKVLHRNSILEEKWSKLKLIEEEKFFVEGIPSIFEK